MAVRLRSRGQVLIIAALAIALSIIALQVYLYDLRETSVSSYFDSLSDYILSVEQGSGHVVETSLIDGGGWLQGWDKRVKLDIDSNDIDGNLTDFPVLIYLSSSSGRNDDDLSFVFDEIGSASDRRKIAVTKSDGLTQCYTEIETWNATSEEAWLWVRVPSISDSSNTELYLYYDADRADNTAFVGDPNSASAEAVWANDFRLVTHMRDDPDTSHVRDSTGYDNDGTKTAPGEPLETTGNVSDAQRFDGDDDVVYVSDDASLNIRTSLTMEAWVNATAFDPQWNDVLSKHEYDIYIEDGRLSAWLDTDAGLYDDCPGGNTTMVVDTWYYVVLTYDAGAITSYIDGELDGTANMGTTLDDSTGWDFTIGWFEDIDEGIHWSGVIDEVRISNVSRSGDWVKATFESGRDDLVDYEAEETFQNQYIEEAVSSLAAYMVRWESFVGGDYAYGLCYLNSTPASQSPYSDGIWMDWGADGKGITSACVGYTLNITGRGAEADLSFAVNTTTLLLISGSYQDMGGDSKAVTASIQLTTDGTPALYGDVAPEADTSDGWTDMTALGDYAEEDHGNGAYTYTFTADIPGSGVSVRFMVHDRRGVYVMAEVTLNEG